MPPPNKNMGKSGKPKNVKQTIKDLIFYYRDYKKMFIVAIILALIGGIAATAAILVNGFIYSRFIIPSMLIQNPKFPYNIDYFEFGIVSFA
jgi:ABC-type multidrug transport system fused ATPase/permease subunit